MNSDRKNISFEYDARSTSETREFSSKLKDLKLSILTKGMNINSEDLNMNPSYTFKCKIFLIKMNQKYIKQI